jgi:hypothetical protein
VGVGEEHAGAVGGGDLEAAAARFAFAGFFAGFFGCVELEGFFPDRVAEIKIATHQRPEDSGTVSRERMPGRGDRSSVVAAVSSSEAGTFVGGRGFFTGFVFGQQADLLEGTASRPLVELSAAGA